MLITWLLIPPETEQPSTSSGVKNIHGSVARVAHSNSNNVVNAANPNVFDQSFKDFTQLLGIKI